MTHPPTTFPQASGTEREMQEAVEERARLEGEVGEILNVFNRLTRVREEIRVLTRGGRKAFEGNVKSGDVEVKITVPAADVLEKLKVIEAGFEASITERVDSLMRYVRKEAK